MRKLLLTTAVYAMTTMPAYAYGGPGMSVGALAVALGILGSIFLALFSVIYYPIKRMLKRRKTKKELREHPAAETEKASVDHEKTAEL